ncbi:unnamed protein product [Leptosia nina]|uniref:Uncharacterized protein n=1 Tax=Leptosia nina TaxID=320188 RepID=A0AAV1J1H5_9NEOP
MQTDGKASEITSGEGCWIFIQSVGNSRCRVKNSVMMRLEASEKQHRYHNLLDDDHANEMLESEGAGLAARVAELEVRCSRQAEELLCLRSTLADALRRLNALEGRAPATTTTQRNGAYSGSSTGTPTRELRVRQPAYREPAKRTSSYGSSASSLPQRRGPQHQSTGSLQSDSPASSSSLSPAPSPSPRATPAPHHVPHVTQPYRSRNSSTSSNQSPSPGATLTKRWNSTGDFNTQGLLPNARFTTTKSLLNLYSKPSQNGAILKHGNELHSINWFRARLLDTELWVGLRTRSVLLFVRDTGRFSRSTGLKKTYLHSKFKTSDIILSAMDDRLTA